MTEKHRYQVREELLLVPGNYVSLSSLTCAFLSCLSLVRHLAMAVQNVTCSLVIISLPISVPCVNCRCLLLRMFVPLMAIIAPFRIDGRNATPASTSVYGSTSPPTNA